MDNASGHTMNLANSIIGVSILAMPYCFKQCGVLLSVFILLISSIISRLACHFLLKSAIMARRKTFEFLAFHIFGYLGKFSIEIGMIGFLLGTCIAFFVVMGDLAPAIISEMTGARIGSALRNSTLIALAVFCVLPLGLLRNVDSLNGVSKATIGFYCCLVLKIVVEALPHIFTGDWVSEVVIWRPAGILQCLPIFSMALFCQTQIFEIYQAIPNASLDKMNGLIRVAVNICTWVYIFVGAFGYIAFFQKPFTGNILLSFRPSITSDVIKMGFVMSLAFSFPLVIFPCRASLYSLLYKGPSYTILHESGPSNYIPEGKFKMLTLFIVSVSLVIGILIPNIELVLGLVGSTIGVMICVLFPVTCFICISPKNTNERILAQIMLFVGVIVMVLGTYANLYAFEEANLNLVTEKNFIKPEVPKPVGGKQEKPYVMDIPTTVKAAILEEKKQKPPGPPIVEGVDAKEKVKDQEGAKEVRHEPPQPVEPPDSKVKDEEAAKEVRRKPPQPEEPAHNKVKDEELAKEVPNPVEPPQNEVKIEESIKEVRREPPQPEEPPEHQAVTKKAEDQEVDHKEDKQDLPEKKKDEVDIVKEAKKIEEVDIEAIKKEELELKQQEEKKKKDENQNQILIETIQKQNEVQKEIVEQQKKLIEVIQKQQEIGKGEDIDKVNEEKVKAVKHIQDIAQKAIESISGKDNKKVEKEDRDTAGQKLEENDKIDVKVVKNEEKKKEEMKNEQPVEVKLKNNEDKEVQKLPLEPLPIALAKLKNATVETGKIENNNTAKNEDEAQIKSMRRDILSENEEVKIRNKREISLNTKEDFNKAMKEVCDEMNRLTSTEKPIIKMLCKLSEPGPVQGLDLEIPQLQNSIDVKPQKRDLKQVPDK